MSYWNWISFYIHKACYHGYLGNACFQCAFFLFSVRQWEKPHFSHLGKTHNFFRICFNKFFNYFNQKHESRDKSSWKQDKSFQQNIRSKRKTYGKHPYLNSCTRRHLELRPQIVHIFHCHKSISHVIHLSDFVIWKQKYFSIQ